MAKFHITRVERHVLVALHTFAVTLVPQLLAVHGHIDRDLLLSVIPAALVTALYASFPNAKKDVEQAALDARRVAKVATAVNSTPAVATVAADVEQVAQAAESAK